jgi:ABC-2 type transport system ATP-binding protein
VTLLRNRPEVSAVAAKDGRLVVDLGEGAEMAPLVSLLVQEGASVEEVRKEQASLEEVFLTLMEEER